MARTRRGRPLDGVLLLDKPAEISSNRALQRARGIFQARKAGHTGSLDLLATGLLPICFGEATKFSHYLLDADKEYRTRCQLGVTTASGDAEGEVRSKRAVPEIDEQRLRALELQFTGTIEQVPPMHSAIKHQGQPLYKKARKGEEVERKTRTVRIEHLQLRLIAADSLELDTRCSKGTYIRSLVEDLGEALGCGAYVTDLRRTGSGPFRLENALTLEQLQHWRDTDDPALDACLLPVDSLLQVLPRIQLKQDEVALLQQGQKIRPVADLPEAELLRVYDQAEVFIGLAMPEEGLLKPKRLLSTGAHPAQA